MASVTLRRLSKVYDGGVQALHHLDLEVRDGELLVLLGPSGSGKTTILRCIAGLEEVTTGEVVIGERVVTNEPPAARDVAMVFQSPALYPHLTVRDNIAFPLELRGVARTQITRRVLEAATRLHLERVLERRPGQISEGERQRAALGRAMVRGPQLFLLDEPLSRLDAQLRIELRGELLALHRALGATMIYVTHDQTEAMTMGQRIAVLHEGRLRQTGTPEEVYQRPADVHVARFIGTPGMNVLQGKGRGTGEKADGGRVIEAGSLAIPIELTTYEGELQVGIRPEYVGLCAVDKGVGNADVLVVEPLGSETLIHLNAGGQPLVARVPGFADVRVGTQVGVKVDRRRLYLFDSAGAPLG
ncbi:MAG: sn-glycerol-3-phosphate ABC transporter ATP-binding protein UgpC [Gemmatimonadetes bacterium]|nr:MAG: sn-glycerol-3-phosphate ABC transporter ATP-binding protein UgpC [Gemmatimonadota bacterium]